MLSPKDLCLSLVNCEIEEEVIEILKKDKYWDKSEDWLYYGVDENNYSIIGNQQSKPEAAIVEKIINSVDAMLMKECFKRSIKPDSEEAPQSIKEALIKFYNIDESKLTNITPKERSKLAENILFVATGSKLTPTYSIIDMGEGQTPAMFHDTLLSLRKSNKLRIPFVQGKFNMGGTGVFRFCGVHNLQLIISRRNPEIAAQEGDPTKDFWGFTVIRREDPSKGARSSNYKYLAPSKQIIFFPADSLPILPGEYPQKHINSLYWGTYIKVFEYKIGPSLRTNIQFDLYNKLSLLMPNVALPIKLYERRKGFTAHTFETILSGLSVRVEEDRSENIEDNFPASGSITVSGQKMKYSIYVFKRQKHEKYTKDEGIIFTINGQTHGYISKSFFVRKSVGLHYLSESILVILDCSDIDGRSMEDLFMNSRDRLGNCPLKSEIESTLEDLLKNHEGLRLLKEKRRKEEIESKLQDSQPLVKVLEEIIKKSPTLSRLFISGLKLSNPFNTVNASSDDIYKGKTFPTYFTLTKKFPENNPKQGHLGSKFRIEFKTDVSNDYFDRSKDPGTFKLFFNNKESENTIVNLYNGYAHLNVPIEEGNINDIIRFRSEVNDISRIKPFEENFFLKIIEPLTSLPTKSGKRKPPSTDKKGNETKKQDKLEIPNIIEVSKDGRSGHSWERENFDEYSGLKVINAGENQYDYYINIDNIHLLTELKSAKSTEINAIVAKYKYGLVLIGLALLNGQNDKNNDNDENENIYSLIERISKSISPIIIPMIDSLSSIDIDEIMSLPNENI